MKNNIMPNENNMCKNQTQNISKKMGLELVLEKPSPDLNWPVPMSVGSEFKKHGPVTSEPG